MSQPDAQTLESDRRTELGRIAGLLFLAGGVASLPAGLLIEDAPRGTFAADALAFLSGVVCLLLPWRRFSGRALHVVAVVATAEVTLSGVVAGAHASVFSPYFILVAIFAGYVFRRRTVVVIHLTLVLAGLLLAALLAAPDDPDALILAMVAGPTLCVANRRRLLVDLDAALLAGRLDAAVPDGGRAYRLGGDEFCVLLAGAGRDADAAVAAACAALASEEEDGGVGCSAGRAQLPFEANTATTALSVADERMYAVKGGDRQSGSWSAPTSGTAASRPIV